MRSDRIFRVGEKMISLDKANRLVERALEFREQGISQQEAARRLHLDRSFISRLEAIGEIRKGNRVAVIGFPIVNTDQLSAICDAYGLDFYLLLTNRQRWDMVKDRQALDFFNQMLELVTRLKEFDTLVMITSQKWRQLAEALLEIQIICLDLGPTPIDEDRHVDAEQFKQLLDAVVKRGQRGKDTVETCSGD